MVAIAPSLRHALRSSAPIGRTTSKVAITSHNQYEATPLEESSLPPEPLPLFREWLASATEHPVREPEAVAFSTCTPEGVPSTRYVLLKVADERGFVIFTNYESRKGKEIAANPFASLAFYWREQSRSVRIVGRTERVAPEETAEYYNSRPLGSRVGAWASPQSQELRSGRSELDRRVDEVERRFGIEPGSSERKPGDLAADADVKIDPPPFWGGIRIVPREVEFWAGRPNRLHDRFVYRRDGDEGPWTVNRLAP